MLISIKSFFISLKANFMGHGYGFCGKGTLLDETVQI